MHGKRKMKPKRKKEAKLKPSIRERKRYLLLGKVKKGEVEKAILNYVGILGYGKAAPVWVKNSILAVNRKESDIVKAALLLADIKVRKVSGTLKGLKSKTLKKP
jgi:RNase P/RNase MRP subunit POP5